MGAERIIDRWRWACCCWSSCSTSLFIFSGFVSETPLARAKMEAWTRSEKEWTGRAGYHLLTHLAMDDGELPDSFFERELATIEREILGRKNRVRDAMNSALIAIGLRNADLQEKALAAAAHKRG